MKIKKIVVIMIGMSGVVASRIWCSSDQATLRSIDYKTFEQGKGVQNLAVLQLQFDKDADMAPQATNHDTMRHGVATFIFPHATAADNKLFNLIKKPELNSVSARFLKKNGALELRIDFDPQQVGMNYSFMDTPDAQGQYVRFYFYNKKTVDLLRDVEDNKKMLKVASCGFCGCILV